MKELEERIITDGEVLSGDILKVGSFLNQKIDCNLLRRMAKEALKFFPKEKVTKVLTIEASGIAFATALAYEYDVELVFAKKTTSSNVNGNLVSALVESYTHGKTYNITVPANYFSKDDKVLIADDFLAKGSALNGLIKIVETLGATITGCIVQIEKVYQNGGNELRQKGYEVIALAGIKSMENGKIEFVH